MNCKAGSNQLSKNKFENNKNNYTKVNERRDGFEKRYFIFARAPQ